MKHVMDCRLEKSSQNSAKVLFQFGLSLLLSAAAYSVPAFAEDVTEHRLSFPIHKNKAFVLPQSFDFEMPESQFLRVGDVLIDANTIKFDWKFLGSKTRVDLQWPAGIVRFGTFAVFETRPDGQRFAIYSTEVTPGKVVLLPIQRLAGSRTENLKAEVASQSLSIPADVVQGFAGKSRLRACLFTEQQGLRAEVCSPLMNSAPAGGSWIYEKTLGENDPRIFLDGQQVGPRGQVFLQLEKTPMEFSAELSTSYRIHLAIRKSPFDLDVLEINPRRRTMKVRGRNLQLTDERIVTEKSSDGQSWIAEVPYERAQFYFKGVNGIPMKQEFSFMDIPIEKLPVLVRKGESQIQTYSESHTTSYELQGNGEIKVIVQGKNSSVTTQGNQLQWQLKNLSKGKTNSDEAQIRYRDQFFLARHEVSRGYPGIARTEVNSLSLVAASLFYGIDTRWGVRAEVSTKDFFIDALARWNRGFQSQEPSLQLGLFAGQTQILESSATSFGLVWDWPFWQISPKWLCLWEGRFGTSSWQTRLLSKHDLKSRWSWHWGLEARSVKSQSAVGGLLGAGFYF